jgi:hypothetical protein
LRHELAELDQELDALAPLRELDLAPAQIDRALVVPALA